ncbi:hypothetical protein [Dyadobacter fermentans]|uniref:Uncharacterized protein n=1 Tax=Dyadobacter fermentans (strain ATCC 700827 / DSM 18053 / CIP 107007 / KCTC 52180 / NS114) TaxID=471854 RepID=C6W0X8_DYAFD|nr:hypothetical protein [Dyadobacter fermentans]ACT95433.1 hypothetical protein Dfer_4230 [Dyadobacter fermentans DSM 18053]
MMKFLTVIIVMLCALMPAHAQVVVNGVDINKEKVEVVEVLVTERFSGKTVNVFVDYGQRTNFRAGGIDGKDSESRIVDPQTKKEIAFASAAALLNFMETNNWEHYDSLLFRENQSATFYFYFRKKK